RPPPEPRWRWCRRPPPTTSGLRPDRLPRPPPRAVPPATGVVPPSLGPTAGPTRGPFRRQPVHRPRCGRRRVETVAVPRTSVALPSGPAAASCPAAAAGCSFPPLRAPPVLVHWVIALREPWSSIRPPPNNTGLVGRPGLDPGTLGLK